MPTSARAPAGFDLQLDAPLKLVRGRCWGFWDEATTERFQRELFAAVQKLERPALLLLDVTALLPQPEQTQATFRQLIASSAAAGLGRAALVATNAITRLQLARLVQEAKAPHWMLVADLAQAQQRLGL